MQKIIDTATDISLKMFRCKDGSREFYCPEKQRCFFTLDDLLGTENPLCEYKNNGFCTKYGSR